MLPSLLPRTLSSPDVFTSSFAVFQDMGFICGLGRGERPRCRAIIIVVNSDETVSIFTSSPALLQAHSNPRSFAVSRSDADEILAFPFKY